MRPPSRERRPRWGWHRWLAVPLTLGLCIYAAWGVDLGATLRLIGGAHPGWLLAAAALIPFEVALTAERWRIGARPLGVPLSRREAFREYALSTWLNQILPGGVAGDLVRVWRTGGEGLGRSALAAWLDRWIGLAVLLMVAVGGLLAWPAVHGLPAPRGALPLLGGLLVGVIALCGLGAGALSSLRAALRPGSLALQLLLSALHTATLLIGFVLCGWALGLPASSVVFTALPLLLLAMSLPLSIGGWGLRELTATALLPTLGWSAEAALSLSAAYGLSVAAGALPGAWVLVKGRAAPIPKGAMEPGARAAEGSP